MNSLTLFQHSSSITRHCGINGLLCLLHFKLLEGDFSVCIDMDVFKRQKLMEKLMLFANIYVIYSTLLHNTICLTVQCT